MNWKLALAAAAAALTLGATIAHAQQAQEPARAMDHGMMGPGRMGPGMMGPGMMGPGMMGPGMMGDRPGHGHGGHHDDDRGGWGMMGRGMGMMGGSGMGRGMMDGTGMLRSTLGAIGRLDLSETQRRQLQKIHDELRRKNWDPLGKLYDEISRIREAMWADKRDRTAILAANKRMSELRQQMLENLLEAAEKAEALLTPQQREQLRRYAP
jgi:Spy/CpxP family protein refolding chaperone